MGSESRTYQEVDMNARYRDSLASVPCSTLPSLLSLLGGGLRLPLLGCLSAEPRTVGALVELLDADQPLVSHDLALLRRRLLVIAQPDGSRRWYRLDERVQAEVRDDRLTLQLATADGDELTLRTRTAVLAAQGAVARTGVTIPSPLRHRIVA